MAKNPRTRSIFAPTGRSTGSSANYDVGGIPLSYMPQEAPVEEPVYEEPSYGGGGGGGGYNYASDPVYQAYIANLDLDLAQRQSDTERRRAQLLGQQDQALYDSAKSGEQSRENISGNYESRGLFNSGGRLRDISRQQADQGTREGRIRQGTATGISDLEYALAQAQAQGQLRRQQASLGIFG